MNSFSVDLPPTENKLLVTLATCLYFSQVPKFNIGNNIHLRAHW